MAFGVNIYSIYNDVKASFSHRDPKAQEKAFDDALLNVKKLGTDFSVSEERTIDHLSLVLQNEFVSGEPLRGKVIALADALIDLPGISIPTREKMILDVSQQMALDYQEISREPHNEDAPRDFLRWINTRMESVDWLKPYKGKLAMRQADALMTGALFDVYSCETGCVNGVASVRPLGCLGVDLAVRLMNKMPPELLSNDEFQGSINHWYNAMGNAQMRKRGSVTTWHPGNIEVARYAYEALKGIAPYRGSKSDVMETLSRWEKTAPKAQFN